MLTRKTLIGCALLAVAAVIASAVAWPRLPDPTPVHWNLAGEADGFGSRWGLALLGPVLTLTFLGLFVAIPIIGPWRKAFEESSAVYNRIVLVLVAMMAGIHVALLYSAASESARMTPALPVIIGVSLAFIGNAFGKIRRNFYVGIRTPWTIASEEVWERTHRAGGRLFVVHGILCAATALLVPLWVCFIILIGGVVAIAIWSVVYSLMLYRKVGERDELPAV
jgi:uncharacterized membrane protein